MNIIDVLVAHHGELRELYRQSEKNSDVFDEFVRHLIVHHTMEEKYFYDLLQQIAEAEHDALEAVNEHHIIELIIKDAEGFPRDHGHFPIKIEGLGEYTTHHLDEEEMEIFPMAQQLLANEDLDALGRLFADAKGKLLGVNLPEVPGSVASRVSGRSSGGAGGKQSAARGLGIGGLKK
jgi:hypothetical protein